MLSRASSSGSGAGDLQDTMSWLLSSESLTSQSSNSIFGESSVFKDIIPLAPELNASLREARDKINDMLYSTTRICTALQVWGMMIPELSEGSLKAAKQNRDSVLDRLREAQNSARQAKQALDDLYDESSDVFFGARKDDFDARDQTGDLQGRLNAQEQADDFEDSEYVHVPRNSGEQSKTDRDIDQVSERLHQLYRQRREAEASIQESGNHQDQIEAWTDFVRETMKGLGIVDVAVSQLGMKHANKNDAAMYRSIIGADWSAPKKRAEEVRAMLGSV